MEKPDWRALWIFVLAARLGSLRKAAAELRVTPQAASHALAQLERSLGVRLFHRTTRALALTTEGERFLGDVYPTLIALQRAIDNVRETPADLKGPLRIVGPRSTFPQILAPLLEEFCTLHPDIVPDIILDDGITNWVESRIDVGFRLGRSPPEGVIARRLFPGQLIICASPIYLRRHGMPLKLADLQMHRCSAFRHPATGKFVPWRVKIGEDIVEQPIAPAIIVNDDALELQMTLAGTIIAQLAGITAIPYIREGRLVPLLIEHNPDDMSYFVYFGSRRGMPKRARAFVDLAVRRLGSETRWILTEEEMRRARQRWELTSPP